MPGRFSPLLTVRRLPHRSVTVLAVLIIAVLALVAPFGAIAQEATPDPAVTQEIGGEGDISQEPVVDEPVIEEPVVEEPVVAEQPVVEQPAPVDPNQPAPETVDPPAAPVPSLRYAVAVQPSCSLAPDQPAAIASGGTIEYVCSDSVYLNGADLVAASVDVAWSVYASVPGGWAVQMLPPVNDPAVEAPVWTAEGASEAAFEFRQVAPLGASQDRITVDASITIEFRVRLMRAVCGMASQTLSVSHDATPIVSDAGATIAAEPVSYQPFLLTPELAVVPEPSVAFDGPLSFGEVGVTADGPETATSSGSVSLTVSGLNVACGTWGLNLGATPLVDESGVPLGGSQLVVVSINDERLPDGGCDLAGGCDAIALAAGPGAPPSQSIVLGVELRMPEQPGLGAFGTSLSASLIPVSAD